MTIEERHTVVSVGPLPSPDILQGYDHVVPGAAERIVVMAENEAKHRHDMDRRVLSADESFLRRGQWCGFSLGIAGLVTSLAALYLGSPDVAKVIGTTTVLGLAAVFVIGRFFPDQPS